MDRNLYERANDCRWWALSPQIISSVERAEYGNSIKDVLKNINSLYTVYENIILFDAHEIIVATSTNDSLLGSKLPSSIGRKTMSLKSSKEYTVSDFEVSPLYEHKPTYIFSAPIFSDSNKNTPIGGIAVVFDAEPQFKAMLEDAIGDDSNSFAIILGPENKVISSSTSLFKPLEKYNICEGSLTTIGDEYFIFGTSESKGYREFKALDNYKESTTAIVFTKIANKQFEKRGFSSNTKRAGYVYPRPSSLEQTISISMFWLYGYLYGIESHFIHVAIEHQTPTKILGSCDTLAGIIYYEGKTIPIASLSKYFQKEQETSANQIIIIKDANERLFGIIVDEVKDTPEIPVTRIETAPHSLMTNQAITKSVIKPDAQDKGELISIIDVEKIGKLLFSSSFHSQEEDEKRTKQ